MCIRDRYASATGVVRLANRYIAKNSESTKMTEFGEDITAKDVFDLAKEGDKGAVAVVEQMSTYLGKAMASIATVVNPQAFIIGGGVSKAGQYLIDAIADVYVKYAFPACREDELQSGSDSEPAMWNLTERTSGRCDNRGH